MELRWTTSGLPTGGVRLTSAFSVHRLWTKDSSVHSRCGTVTGSTVDAAHHGEVRCGHYVGQMEIATGAEAPRVEVRRSRRRTRTVSAFREKDAIVVLVPARLSAAEESVWVGKMVERVVRAERRRRPSDDELATRCRQLSHDYLESRAQPTSVRWVGNQRSRWGSCTPADRTIRISDRVRGMPSYVVDYVLLHELTHLIVGGHGPEFWAWVRRYPKVDRARGFLEGVAATAHLNLRDVDDEDDAADVVGPSSGTLPPADGVSAVAGLRGGA